MGSILEEFAYGNVMPQVQACLRDSEYDRAVALAVRNEQKLLSRLGTEDKDLLQKYVDAQDELNQITAVKNLVYGYKLGLLMASEAFADKDKLYTSVDLP